MSKPKSQTEGKISITILLATAIGGLVAIAVSVVLIISALANFRNTFELMQVSANQTIDSLERQLDSQLKPARRIVEYIASQAMRDKIDLDNKREVITTMRASLGTTSDLTGIAIWRPDGREIQVRRTLKNRFVVYETDNSDNALVKGFLETIKKSKKPIWSVPLRIDGLSFISISAPIFKKGKFIGVVSAGISISSLSHAIASIENNTSFTGYVLVGDQYVLAHKNIPSLPQKNLSFEKPLHRIDDINDAVLSKFASAQPRDLDTTGFDIRNISDGKTQYVALSRSLSKYGIKQLNIGVYVPREEVNGQLQRMFLSIAVGMALLLAAIIAAIILARLVSRPVKKISAAASRVGALELDQIRPLAPSRIRELDQQARSFNQMLDALKWFEAYVPKRLVRRLIEQQDGDDVASSREEELTVMFTDIIGFTAMSENLSPSDTAKMLNEHFECMNECIQKTDGTLDKYIGDAVMAFWGAPDRQHDHALRACETAICVMETLAKNNSKVRIKIAIHTGPLIVGNIGSKARMNYTVIGDTVNTCSRLEKIAGELDDGRKVTVVLSDVCARAVQDTFVVEPAGNYQVRGRAQTVTVYRLLGRKN